MWRWTQFINTKRDKNSLSSTKNGVNIFMSTLVIRELDMMLIFVSTPESLISPLQDLSDDQIWIICRKFRCYQILNRPFGLHLATSRVIYVRILTNIYREFCHVFDNVISSNLVCDNILTICDKCSWQDCDPSVTPTCSGLEQFTENDAVFKTAQNTFNINWRRLPVALGL